MLTLHLPFSSPRAVRPMLDRTPSSRLAEANNVCSYSCEVGWDGLPPCKCASCGCYAGVSLLFFDTQPPPTHTIFLVHFTALDKNAMVPPSQECCTNESGLMMGR